VQQKQESRVSKRLYNDGTTRHEWGGGGAERTRCQVGEDAEPWLLATGGGGIVVVTFKRRLPGERLR
jgi:hypothetical protein